MKVLFIAHWFPTTEHPQKGVFIKEQAKALIAVGVHVQVLHINISEGGGFFRVTVDQFSDSGIDIVRLNLVGKLWKLIYTVYPVQLWLVNKHLKQLEFDMAQFDLVHSHVVHPSGAMGNKLAEAYGLPHFISEHWSNLEYYFSKNMYRKWGREAYSNAKRIFVVSEFLKKGTAKYVSDGSKLLVVPNVVPSDEFKFRPVAIGTSYYLVMAAKWNKGKRVIKRPKLLIKAVAEAAKELDKPIILGVIGDGDLLSELKKYCIKHDVHAQFHGLLSKAQIAKEFQKADLFLHGSEYETFSVVVAEALKCGTPVVASNVAAIPELINLQSGILVENKLLPWKDAIVQALRTDYDRPQIADAFKNRFGYEEVGRLLLDAYKQELD